MEDSDEILNLQGGAIADLEQHFAEEDAPRWISKGDDASDDDEGPEEEDSSAIRVVQYNILSSALGGADYFIYCKKENCDPAKRLAKLYQKLEAEMDCDVPPIFALQEVSMEWAGYLHAFFNQHQYTMVQSLYGSYFNDFMGVAIAFPTAKYDLLECKIKRISETVKHASSSRKLLDRPSGAAGRAPSENTPRPPLSSLACCLSCFVALLTVPIRMFNWAVRKISPAGGSNLAVHLPTSSNHWEESKRRWNSMVILKLRQKAAVSDSGSVAPPTAFCIGTYHIPCAITMRPVITIHSAWALQYLQKWAGSATPYIFAGDFNFKPTDAQYTMYTTGSMDPEHPDYPLAESCPDDSWAPTPFPCGVVRSAYQALLGKEPNYTNYSRTTRDTSGPFVDTLDYIWLSKHWKVKRVLQLPHREDTDGPLPNDSEPSDHIMVGAELTLLTD